MLNEKYRIYSQLKDEYSSLDREDVSLVRNSKTLRYVESYDSDIPKLKRAVSVGSDFLVTVAVHDRILPTDHDLWESVSRVCTDVRILDKILTAVSELKICIGNPDKDLQTLIPFGAYLDTNSGPNTKDFATGI